MLRIKGYAVIKEEVDELWDYIKASKSIKPNIKWWQK